MTNAISYPKNFFSVSDILCDIAGVWRKPDTPKWRKYLFNFIDTIALFFGTVFIILEFLMFEEASKDIIKFFSHIGLLVSNLLVWFKIYFMIIRRKEMRHIMDTLHDETYEYEDLNEFKPALTLQNEKKFTQMCTILIMVLYLGCGVSAHISSEVTLHEQVKGTIFEGNTSCQGILSHSFLIPIEINTKAQCELVLVYMDVTIFAYGWCVGCFDTFFAALLNCLKTHLVVLSDAIRTVRKRVLVRLGMDEEFEILHDESMPILEEELYKELTHVTKHLVQLLSIAQKIEEVFNIMILVQTLTSLFNIASCLFSATKVPIGSPVFFSIIEYFSCVMVELSLICWFGSGITHVSDEIFYALYDTDWLSGSRRFKRSLIITMCRMQRPIYLTIGNFFPLTLRAIVSVSKASFSYYTVFGQADE